MSFNAARLYDFLPSGPVAESAGEQLFYLQGMGSSLTEVKKKLTKLVWSYFPLLWLTLGGEFID